MQFATCIDFCKETLTHDAPTNTCDTLKSIPTCYAFGSTPQSSLWLAYRMFAKLFLQVGTLAVRIE